MRRHRGRKIRNLLLKRGFQLRYTGMVLGISVVLSIALGSFLLVQVRENSRMLALEAEFDPIFAEQVARSDLFVTVVLVVALFVFNVVLALVSIAVTHRMAGPVYVLEGYLDALAAGRLPEMRPLRRGDEFVDLWAALRRLVDAEERAAQRDVEILQAVLEPLERQGDVSAHALRELLDRRLALLSGADSPRAGQSLDARRSRA